MIIRFKKLLFAGLLLPFCAHAQWLQNPFLDEMEYGAEKQHEVLAGYSYKLASTALTNRFFNDYLFTPFIEDDVKNTVLPNLKDGQNYFGTSTEKQLLYTWGHKPKQRTKNQYMYYAGMKDRLQRGCHFTSDVYRVLLYGNKDYAGRSAVADGTAYVEQLYQTLQGGVIIQRYIPGWTGRKITYGGGIGVVKGGRIFFDLKVDEGSIYTSPTGDSIFVRAKSEAAYNGIDVPRARFSGIGLSSNFFIQFPVSKKSTLAAAVTDLGFISYFAANTTHFSSDEAFGFSGYELDFTDGISGAKFILDSLSNRADSLKTRDSHSRMVPTQVQLSYVLRPAKNWDIKLGMEYLIAANSRLQYYGAGTYRFTEKSGITAGVQVRGYNNWGLITVADLQIKKRIHLRAGTENLEGWFNADKTTAQSAFGQVRVGF